VERKGKRGHRREGEGIWNSAADWLRPALESRFVRVPYRVAMDADL